MERQYDRESAEIAAAYAQATADIRAQLNRFSASNMTNADAKETLAAVAATLATLNVAARKWAETYVPVAAEQALFDAVVAIEASVSVQPTLSRVNKALVTAAIEDTQADLLAVTQNVSKKTKAAVRKAVADAFRTKLTAGENGRRAIQRQILANLDRSAQTGIIDAIGRRWKPEVYVRMAAHTKLNRVNIDVTVNSALERGVQYGMISRHGATDACGAWEGKIVKFSPDAPGDYPYIGDLQSGTQGIFHPACRHHVSPVAKPE